MEEMYVPKHDLYAFLDFDMGLSLDDRLHFVTEAISMYKAREEKRTVKGEQYEGVLKTDGKRAFVGGFAGQVYEAIVETNYGKSNLSFILSQKLDPSLN